MNPNHHIVIAEDNEDDVFILQRALQKAGIPNPTHICNDGEEVINYLKAVGPYADRQNYPFPRMLILDLKMPRLSGFDVLRWLRGNPDCSVIPTMVLTSSREPKDVQEAYRLGVNAYLVKPPTFEELQSMLMCVSSFWTCCEVPELPLKC